ncbi:MAG TPA: maleylpyruvate isomerase family mycothiol-dependent enzyme [Acidimicrobiales bacterium]|nr:maleylpyruvate isomerase family mycothiol-dependent enzyme [Acidimicrobiales bacterium]
MTALQQTWEGLADVSRELSTSEWALPTECPGWDVKDQLSHLIGIELAIMGEPTPAWDGEMGAHVKNDFAATNEPWIAVRRSTPGPDVWTEFVGVTRARLAEEAQNSDEDWAKVGFSPVGQRPRAVFMEVRVFDSWVHEQDVRRALDRPGGSGNLASAMSLTRVQEAMPFVVGKQASCPDGTAVRFDIAGPGDDARAFTIAVEGGRARPVDGSTTPAATLSMSSIDFVRLGCGRATAAQLAEGGADDGVVIDGDEVVGRQVLDAMNFMF